MIPHIKSVDPDSGLDAACAPIWRIASLLGELKRQMQELPGTVSEPELARVVELVGGAVGKAAPAAAAAPAKR